MSIKLNKVPETVSSDLLYDMVHGGYYKAEEFSDDPDTINKIKEAIEVVEALYQHLEDNDLVY